MPPPGRLALGVGIERAADVVKAAILEVVKFRHCKGVNEVLMRCLCRDCVRHLPQVVEAIVGG